MTESLLSATTGYNLACPVYISHGAIMTRENEHQQTIIEQFSLQAIPFAALPGHSNSISLLIELCGPTAAGNVLDVACGPGLVACEFARVARSVTGIDLTPAMLTAARERQRAAGLNNMEWLEGAAFPLTFADHSFDAVLTRYSFHHFIEPALVLSEMVRVTRPGGRVLVADVAMPASKVDAYDRLERLRDPSHVHALEIGEFAQLFRDANLEHVTSSTYEVELELEEQLRASFPKAGDADRIREMCRADVGHDRLGIRCRVDCHGVLRYSVPILVLAGTRRVA